MARRSRVGDEEPSSDFQWYLWVAGINAHFYGLSTRQLTRSQFDELIEHVLAAIPDLRLAADMKRQVHNTRGVPENSRDRMFEELERFDMDLSQWLQARDGFFEGTARPAFLARCLSAREAGADGVRSIFYLQTCHAHMEGLDVSRLVRGVGAGSRVQKRVRQRLPLAQRVLYSVLACLIGPLAILGANILPARNAKRRFWSMRLCKRDVHRLAHEVGVGQRALCFALVLRGLHGRRRRHNFIYTALPAIKYLADDDPRIAVHGRSARVRSDVDFCDFARRLEREMRRADARTLQMHYVAIRTFRVFRLVGRYLPCLFRRRFKRFLPFDMVLSMLPPVLPSGRFSELIDGPVYGGVATHGSDNCVLSPGREVIAVNLWLDERSASRLPQLLALAKDIGIGVGMP